ncbi:MAG: SGNH/GDSL hydrolase family protein [Pirellulales bacterium]
MENQTMFRLVVVLIISCMSLSSFAQKPNNPAFSPPKSIQSDLPNVLIIGDSISIGYMLPLRKQLDGVANVFRPTTNCGPTIRGLEQLDSWLGDRKWDLIQWNHGLHDLKYMGPKGENLSDPDDATSHQQVPPKEYEKNLHTLTKRLKKTGATLVFCETTPVPEGAGGRVVGDSKKYNAIAQRVMREENVAINTLFDFASENVPTRPANVHYTSENSEKLAAFLAADIKKRLAQHR